MAKFTNIEKWLNIDIHTETIKKQEIANLEFQLGCWHQDYLSDPTEENLRGLLDAEIKLQEARK